jgi:putative MATE family efflux protein
MKKRNVLEGSIKNHMLRLALPSIGGMFAITAFNLTDTYFVSKLGTDALAAMGFTFPVVMVVGSISSGISLGAASVLARAMGSGNEHKMHRIATDGIFLSILTVFIISIIGYFTMDPLFKALGASGESLRLVKEYMSIWYIGAFVVVVPPVSDSAMRAMGDMIRPLIVMLICAIGNVILDPILIFGWFGLPAMGIEGAALATIISRFLGMIATLSFVAFHYKLIDFKYKSFGELFESWTDIIRIGIPNVLVRLLPQVLRAIMTRLAASIAIASVAAIAAGQRIESFATIISMAVGVSIVPIIGQNFGASKFSRVLEMRKILIRFAVLYGVVIAVLVFPVAEYVSSIFSSDAEVIKLTAMYIRIVFIGSIGLNQYNWISEAFNAAGKPRYSLQINLVGTVFIILPLVYVGAKLFNFQGMLFGLVLGQVLVGIYAIYLSRHKLVGDV